MKLTTGIVALAMTAGMAWAQNPASIIQNTKSSLQGAQQQKSAAVDSALQATGTPSKPSPATASNHLAPAPAAAKPAATPAAPAQTVKVVPTKTAPAPAKVAPVAMKTAPAPAKVTPPAPAPKVAAKPAAPAVPPARPAAAAATPVAAPKAPKPEEKKYSMTGKRDPFISPVVNRQGGSGCSTGKKCLDIEQIAVRGVVKADTGMIAVVTNGLNKAYFLRENDPVFNGYVVKITVDSVVFKQNFQDRLGKPFTKDVVKRITTPAV
jgi:Tfp pilus assembly protein PilP